MPANKSQHYVPQFYMKLFANQDGKFNIYNVESGEKYENIPYKGQCQKDYFYGKDLVLENKFRDMETEWSIVFNKIINEEELTKEDVGKIKQFAVYQSARTAAAVGHSEETMRSHMIELVKMECMNKNIPTLIQEIERVVDEKVKEKKDEILFPIHYSEECISYMDDLNIVVMTYNTTGTLISSDTPVVNANKFLEGDVGYANAGFCVFFRYATERL